MILRFMSACRLTLAAIVAVLALAASALASVGQPVATEHRSPAGIAFRHIAMPGDTHQALTFTWADGYALTHEGKEGLAALGPHLLLQGSRTVNESERIERLKDLQASVGLSGGGLYTRGSVTAPKATFSSAAALLADLLADPALPADRLARTKRNWAVSWRQSQEQTETLANQLFMRLVLGPSPQLKIALAEPAMYDAITVADVDAWRRAVLGRQPLAIVSAGPLAPEPVAADIDRIFAGLPAVTGIMPPPPKLRAPGKLVVLERASAVQTAIVAGGPSAWTLGEAEALEGAMAMRVLGSGFESRLMKAVREGLGAAYGIRAGLQQTHPRAFSMVISSSVDNARAGPALAAIRKEYARFREEGVTEAEVAPLQIKLITEQREYVRRSWGAAGRLRDLIVGEFPADYLATYETRVAAATAAGVNEGIRTRLPAPPLTVVMVAPSADNLGADCVLKTPADLAKCE